MNYTTIKAKTLPTAPVSGSACLSPVAGIIQELLQSRSMGFWYVVSPSPSRPLTPSLRICAPVLSGAHVLGGEPFDPLNQSAVVELLRQIKTALPERTVCGIHRLPSGSGSAQRQSGRSCHRSGISGISGCAGGRSLHRSTEEPVSSFPGQRESAVDRYSPDLGKRRDHALAGLADRSKRNDMKG